MKVLSTTLIMLLSFQSIASDELKTEICTAFADENSGVFTESDSEGNEFDVIYGRDLAFGYCMDNAELKAKNDNGFYYEFELFVCNGVYQYETIAYSPDTKTLEYLGGSGSSDDCPYKLEE